MSLTQCYWFDSFAELDIINGADITGYGTGEKFEVDDVIFIYDDDGELLIYVCVEYSASEAGNPPYIILGPLHPPTSEKAVFYLLNLAYTSSCMKLSYELNVACDSSPNAQLTCDMLDLIRDERPLLFHDMVKTSENLPSADNVTLLDDTTEADWVEELGADLDWEPDGVKIGGVPGTGELLHVVSQSGEIPPVYFSSVTGRYTLGVRLSSEHFIYFSPTRLPSICHVSFDGVVTVIDQAVIPGGGSWADFGLPGFSLNAVYCDKLVVGAENYTGSKPEQGRLFLWNIASDYTFDAGVIIDVPTPARYGHFGRYDIGFAVVDDSVYGEDQHIIAYNGVELIFMRESNGYSTEHQVIVFPRDTWMRSCAGGRNYLMILVNDGAYKNYSYHFDGTTWNEITNVVTTNYYGAQVISDNGFMSMSSDLARYYELTPSARTYRGSANGNNLPAQRVKYSMYGSRVWAGGQYNDTTPNAYLYYCGVGVAPVLIHTLPFTDHGQDYTGVVMGGRDGSNFDKLLIPNDYILTYARGKEGTPFVYTVGHFHFSSTANSRIVIPAGVAEINAASVQYEEPANSDVRFAFSLDGGITWYSWSITTYDQNVQLASLEDIEINGAGAVYFNVSMKDINVILNPVIDLAFSLDRPATVADNSTPKIMSYTYNTIDILGQKIHTTRSSGNAIVDTRADNSEYDLWLSTMYLLNFDDLK